MSEIEAGQELLDPEWKDAMRVGITDALDNVSLIFSAGEETPPSAIDFSPIMLTQGVDERGYDELDDIERAFIQKEFLSIVGFQERSEHIAETYEFDSPEGAEYRGRVNVTIFRTPRSDESLFVHKVVYPDGKNEFLIAPETYRL